MEGATPSAATWYREKRTARLTQRTDTLTLGVAESVTDYGLVSARELQEGFGETSIATNDECTQCDRRQFARTRVL